MSKPQHAGLRAFLLGVLVGVFLAVLPWKAFWLAAAAWLRAGGAR